MPDIKKSTIVPYSAKQMFDLVNDIENYPAFIPACKSTEILSRNEDEIRATLHFSRGAISKSFTTLNRLQKDKMIEIRLLEGPFRHLEGLWRFETLVKNKCNVMLDLEFEFSNRLLSFAFEPIFMQVANMLVDAFKNRADTVYSKNDD